MRPNTLRARPAHLPHRPTQRPRSARQRWPPRRRGRPHCRLGRTARDQRRAAGRFDHRSRGTAPKRHNTTIEVPVLRLLIGRQPVHLVGQLFNDAAQLRNLLLERLYLQEQFARSRAAGRGAGRSRHRRGRRRAIRCALGHRLTGGRCCAVRRSCRTRWRARYADRLFHRRCCPCRTEGRDRPPREQTDIGQARHQPDQWTDEQKRGHPARGTDPSGPARFTSVHARYPHLSRVFDRLPPRLTCRTDLQD